MKLWLLEPRTDLPNVEDTILNPWKPWFDKAFGFVVRAETEQEARQIAQDNAGCEDTVWTDEPGDYRKKWETFAWLNPMLSTCVELTADGPAKLILRDYAAA